MTKAAAKRQGEYMSTVVSMKALLESGVHFGHRTNKWNPLMRPYIFTERNGIHIIDLQQTVKTLNTAYNYVRDLSMAGGTVLFVGTKRQAQETIKEEAIRCGSPYVTERWLGGMLTNWSTIFLRIQELERLEKMQETGEIHRLPKKEGLLIQREVVRLTTRLSGIRTMKKLPDLVFIIDVMREETCVKEANKKEIPVLALVDTNCDPRGVDYVIPSNDDAIRAIKLLVGKIADAVIEGRSMRKDEMSEEQVEAAVSVETVSKPRAQRTPAIRMVDEEMDLDDKDLLGDSTLAKLTPHVEAAAVEPEVVVPVVETPVAEPTVEPAVETVVETTEIPAEAPADEPKTDEDPQP
jgi:small subunit ribosomal protein S2